MTTPAPPVPQPPANPPGWEVFTERALEILAIEEAARRLVGPFRVRFQRAQRDLTAAWVRAAGSVHDPTTPAAVDAAVAVLRRELEHLDYEHLVPDLERAVDRAMATGVQHAVDSARDQVARSPALGVLPAPRAPFQQAGPDLSTEVDDLDRTVRLEPIPGGMTVRQELRRLDRSIRDRVTDAVREADRLGTQARWSEIQGVLLRAQQAATGAEATAVWCVQAAANAGARAVARRLGVERVWVAERNACVVCLALSGTVSVHGEFDAGLTYGPHSIPVWPAGPLWQPPRHPWCRCRAEVWLGSVPGYTGPDLPAALRREADRSILSGWRVTSESEHVRVAAAVRLLASGTSLPKTVRNRARRAVLAGSFGPSRST